MTRTEAEQLRLGEFKDALAGLVAYPAEATLDDVKGTTLALGAAPTGGEGTGGLMPAAGYTPFLFDHYDRMPERLALWTISEPYYAGMTQGAIPPGKVWPSYRSFASDPFAGSNFVNLYATVDGWLSAGAWDTSSYMRGEDECEEASYSSGFRRAAIPVIPYMVDTITPPQAIKVPRPPDIDLSTYMKISDLPSYLSSYLGGGNCVDVDDGEITVDIECLLDQIDWSLNGRPLQVLGRNALGVGWVNVKACDEEEEGG